MLVHARTEDAHKYMIPYGENAAVTFLCPLSVTKKSFICKAFKVL